MRLLDLFSGIGGFSLAAEWVWGDELEIVAFCEIEKYCQKVLQKNFPGVPIYEDITKLNGKDFKDIDLLTGGFPCQDISIAGKGAGIEGSRSGLWFEMWRIISEIRPRFALIENVPMLTIRGGTRVIADLAEIGYDAEWQVIGADDVGAWHRRKRIWIVAYPRCSFRDEGSKKQRRLRRQSETRNTRNQFVRPSKTQLSTKDVADTHESGSRERQISGNLNDEGRRSSETGGESLQSEDRQTRTDNLGSGSEDVPDTASEGLERGVGPQYERPGMRSADEGETVPDTDSFRCKLRRTETRPRETDIARSSTRQEFISTRCESYWAVEPDVGRVANGIPSRVDRLKGLGNAIVPQVAALIMKRIKNETKTGR